MRYRIHIFAALFLIVGMGVQIVASYRQARRHVQKRLDLEMQIAQEKLTFELYDAYDAVGQLEKIVREDQSTPEQLMEVTRAFIERYPNFYTCYVAFPENRYAEQGRWCCPSSYRVHDSIFSNIYGDEGHDYFKREWYDGALHSLEAGYWSQPYRDEDFDETIYTYSDDIRDEEGKLIAVVGLDFSLRWMSELLKRFKPFDDVVLELYSSSGALLTSSDKNGNAVGRLDNGEFDSKYWVVSRRTLNPVGINMIIAVPQCFIWEGILPGIVLPFCVFLLGIIVVAVLFRRMWKDSQEKVRLATEKEVMARELQIAHGIQMGILRHDFPMDDDVQVHADLIPMREVGGDLYDFHREGDNLWFIVGDVSGKGVPAAMFMSATVNLFRAAGRRQNSPKGIMEEINMVLSDNNPSMTFVTALVGKLNVKTGQLLYCNAGHCEPIKVKSERSKVKGDRREDAALQDGASAYRIEVEPNIPLGYDGKFRFVEQGTMLGEGEQIVLYTDGVTEARNSERVMLGMKRWTEMVAQGGDLLQAVKRYIGAAEPTDDITLMTVSKVSAVEPLTLRVESKIEHWTELRAALRNYALCAGMNVRAMRKIEVAIEEVVVNIVNYSGAEWMEMEIEKGKVKGERLEVTLRDNGGMFDPTQQAEVDTDAVTADRQIGGLGIALVRQIADELSYRRRDGINELIITKNI